MKEETVTNAQEKTEEENNWALWINGNSIKNNLIKVPKWSVLITEQSIQSNMHEWNMNRIDNIKMISAIEIKGWYRQMSNKDSTWARPGENMKYYL